MNNARIDINEKPKNETRILIRIKDNGIESIIERIVSISFISLLELTFSTESFHKSKMNIMENAVIKGAVKPSKNGRYAFSKTKTVYKLVIIPNVIIIGFMYPKLNCDLDRKLFDLTTLSTFWRNADLK